MSSNIGLAVATELPTKHRQINNSGINAGLRLEAVLVRDALLERGLETPMIINDMSAEEKQLQIKDHFTDILEILGLDLTDDSLCDTHRRIAKMYVKEIFSGLDYSNFPKLTVIENKMQVDEMVRVKNIDLSSR